MNAPASKELAGSVGSPPAEFIHSVAPHRGKKSGVSFPAGARLGGARSPDRNEYPREGLVQLARLPADSYRGIPNPDGHRKAASYRSVRGKVHSTGPKRFSLFECDRPTARVHRD